MTKGETLLDTVKNLEAMHPDILVVRHGASGAPHYIAARTRARVVNAGDGTHEHPTQALLDAFTIRRAKGKIAGLTVAICGDIAHSRVARSNAHAPDRAGRQGPVRRPAHASSGVASTPTPCETFDRVEPAIEGADVVMALRIQQRAAGGRALAKPARVCAPVRDQSGASRACQARCHRDAPGPDQPRRRARRRPSPMAQRSVILDQVEAGVAVRMAVLYLLSAEPGQAPLA